MSRQFNEEFGKYTEEASEDLLTTRDLVGLKEFTTELPERKPVGDNYLKENRSFTVNTNATKDLVEKSDTIKSRIKRVQEALKFGATEDDLEKEVKGSFGKEILEIFQNHGITGKAVWEAIDVLKDILGKEPNVDDAINSWSSSDDVSDEEDTNEDESDDTSDEDDEDLEESIRNRASELRRKILARKMLERQSF